jgi:hypothetical protein
MSGNRWERHKSPKLDTPSVFFETSRSTWIANGEPFKGRLQQLAGQ